MLCSGCWILLRPSISSTTCPGRSCIGSVPFQLVGDGVLCVYPLCFGLTISHKLQDLKLENLLLVKYKDPQSSNKRLVAKLAEFGLLVVSLQRPSDRSYPSARNFGHPSSPRMQALDRADSVSGPLATKLTGETGSAMYM